MRILQFQSTIPHPTQMRGNVGANCRYFWYKNLFYILFVGPISVHGAGGYTLWYDIVGLVPVMLLGYHTIDSLDPAY